MNRHTLISTKQLIGEMYQDFNITNDDWVNKAQRWIERGMGLMKIDGYFEIARSFQDVKDYIAPLPCDQKYIIVTLSNINGLITRLPITRDLALGANFDMIETHSTYRGAFNYNGLRTNFEEGRVLFIYYRNPIDQEGNLLIPDSHEIMEALQFFIIYKMSLSGYKHPVIDISTAEAKWKELYPRARNVVNFPSIEEMHRLTQMANNPLFLDIIDEEWNIITDRSIIDTDLTRVANTQRIMDNSNRGISGEFSSNG